MKLLSILLLFGCLLSPGVSRAVSDNTVNLTTTEATATTTSGSVLSAQPKRNYLLIQNKGTVNVYIGIGAATTGTEGIVIPAGGNYEPFKVSGKAIFAQSASGSQPLVILEGLTP